MPIVKVENLRKKYTITHHQQGSKALRDVMTEKLKSFGERLVHPFSFQNSALTSQHASNSSSEEFWALDDVSFEIEQGSRVGIIGRNGAGKSTLLKILSRITEPTSGEVGINGRVASLLEVGTGFHPELTGRENIFLNGAILGMSRNDITRQFDEIVAFSEVEKFIDTPVKHYSSGMYARLAFAVAAHLEPDILIVDEALAVGDAEFQRKCLGKMEYVSAKEGRTVIFVSHNMGAIVKLCSTAIWLDSGKIVGMGGVDEVVRSYQVQNICSRSMWTRPDDIEDNDSFNFTKIEISNSCGSPASHFRADESVIVTISYEVRKSLLGCQVGVRFYNTDGVVVFSTADSDGTDVSALPKNNGLYRTQFTVPANFFRPGSYTISIGSHLPHRTVYEILAEPVTFNVSNVGWIGAYDGRLGIVSPVIVWDTAK